MTTDFILTALLALAGFVLALAGIAAPFAFREITLPLLKWVALVLGLALLWAGWLTFSAQFAVYS